MASLYALLTEINAEITTAGCEKLIGPQYIEQAGVTPRVVWEYVSESPLGPQGQGPAGQRTIVARPLWTRKVLVKAHLWASDCDTSGIETSPGANLDAAENLLNDVMRAIHKVCTNYTYQWAGTSEWVTQAGSNVTFGVVYVLPIEFYIPITRLPSTPASVTQVEATMQIQPVGELPETDTTIVIT